MTPRTVLLLDDDAARAVLVHDILVASGCEVEIVLDAREAIQRLRRRAFGLIVVGPPLLGTAALIRRLRARALGLPIVAITSAATPEAGERLIRAGAAAWLAEPLTPRRLLAQVEQFFELQSGTSSA